MAKLHELLAVKDNLRSQAETTRADLKNTFEKKRTHFMKKTVTVKSLKEGVEDKTEVQMNLQTSVAKELEWISEKLRKAIDTAHQVEVANTQARADVVLEDGFILLSNIPVTSLLELEKRLHEIQDLVVAIPTLDPAQGFEPDITEGDGIFKARDVEKPRTEKVFDYVVMVPAVDKHPAQVKELMLDKVVATTITQEWSSLITVAAKGHMLDRVEDVIRAVKKARSRANDTEINVREDKIGNAILRFVFNGNA